MIKAVQQETKGAVIAMDEGVSEVGKGSEKAASSGKALDHILYQINAVTAQIHQVGTAAEEQTATISEISNNMQQITEVVSQTGRGAHESASSEATSSLIQVNFRNAECGGCSGLTDVVLGGRRSMTVGRGAVPARSAN